MGNIGTVRGRYRQYLKSGDAVYFKESEIQKLGVKYYTYKCNYLACGKVFYSTNPYIRYHSGVCRHRHFNCTEEGEAFIGLRWLSAR